MNKDQSDSEIVHTILEHDKELYREIVRRYQHKLLRYASSLIKEHEIAQDIIQNVFIKAYINLRGYNPKYQFSSWIYRIAHNEAINYLRKHRDQTNLSTELWQSFMDGTHHEPEVEFDKTVIKEKITACLNELPLKYREPIVLFYLDEETYESISDILRIPQGTVAVRISRGKKILKAICDKKHV